jgi:hypothetical protein
VKEDGLLYKSGGGGVNTSMEVKKRTGRGGIASRELQDPVNTSLGEIR